MKYIKTYHSQEIFFTVLYYKGPIKQNNHSRIKDCDIRGFFCAEKHKQEILLSFEF